ncbi:MAG: hypothetical protein IJC04_00315 [Oscillospiraceae bacterium]|nr:hypothetical protein [Oscillospiraceae bacterium]
MIAATLLFTKKETTAEGFLAGNHNLGTVVSALSVAATWIWAPSLFTSAEKAYTNGLPGLFWFLVPNVLCLFFFIPFAKKIRKEQPTGISLSDYMYSKYNSKGVKKVYTFELGALSMLSTAVQLLAGGKMLSLLTGLPLILTTIILAIIAFSYSQFSGIKSSVLTDALQMVFMLITGVSLALCAFKFTGGYGNLLNGLSGHTGEFGSLFSKSGLDVFLGFGLPTAVGLIAGPFGDQSFWQRAFAVNKNKIGKAFGFGAILFGIIPFSMGMLGYMAAGTGMPVSDVSVVNLELIKNLFPNWVLLPFLFMIISGLLSTVDSNLCSFASLMYDKEKKFDVKKSKIGMIALLIISVGIANIPGLTVTHLFLLYGTFRASTMLPTVMTLKGVKLTAKSVYLGVIIALLLGMPIFAYGNIANIAIMKTIGSLTTVLTSGIAALIITKLEVRNETSC